MDILILTLFGAIVAVLVAKPYYDKRIDVAMGAMGALVSGSMLSAFRLNTVYGFFIITLGTLLIIYVGRSLEDFPLV